VPLQQFANTSHQLRFTFFYYFYFVFTFLSQLLMAYMKSRIECCMVHYLHDNKTLLAADDGGLNNEKDVASIINSDAVCAALFEKSTLER